MADITISQTAVVRIKLEDGKIGFNQLAAVYRFDLASTDIGDVLATSMRTGREVNFTHDRSGKIYTAELAPMRQSGLPRFVGKAVSAFKRLIHAR